MKGYNGVVYESDTNLGHEDLSVPYFINCCGYLKTTGIDVALNRCRKDFYLVYLVNGIGHYKLSQGTVTAEAGSIIIYKPGEKQDYYYLGHEKAEIYWIHFTGSEAGKLLENLSLSEKNIYKTGVDASLTNLFEEIIREIQIRKPNFHALCIGYLLQLLSMLSRKATFLENGEGIYKNSSIETAIRLMNAEYQQWNCIDYYAQKCNLSVYQFIKNFKKVTHLPPAKYLEKVRMTKAKELLIGTNLTVSEIAGIVGYDDAFYFSKVFKKVTSMTPTSFRASRERPPWRSVLDQGMKS